MQNGSTSASALRSLAGLLSRFRGALERRRRPRLVFYTFCVDIGRFPQETLISVANAWLEGFRRSGTQYDKLVIYTNLPLVNSGSVRDLQIRAFPTTGKTPWDWVSLISSKFEIGAELDRELGVTPIWIDLDTFVTGDLGYLRSVPEFCTVLGSSEERPMRLHREDSSLVVSRRRMINTSFFKIGPEFRNRVIEIVEEEGGKLPLGDQDAFNIAYYFRGLHVPVLGHDLFEGHRYSYDAWGSEKAEHINEVNSLHLSFETDQVLRSDLYPEDTVDMIQFTFRAAKRLLNDARDTPNSFLEIWRSCAALTHIELDSSR